MNTRGKLTAPLKSKAINKPSTQSIAKKNTKMNMTVKKTTTNFNTKGAIGRKPGMINQSKLKTIIMTKTNAKGKISSGRSPVKHNQISTNRKTISSKPSIPHTQPRSMSKTISLTSASKIGGRGGGGGKATVLANTKTISIQNIKPVKLNPETKSSQQSMTKPHTITSNTPKVNSSSTTSKIQLNSNSNKQTIEIKAIQPASTTNKSTAKTQAQVSPNAKGVKNQKSTNKPSTSTSTNKKGMQVNQTSTASLKSKPVNINTKANLKTITLDANIELEEKPKDKKSETNKGKGKPIHNGAIINEDISEIAKEMIGLKEEPIQEINLGADDAVVDKEELKKDDREQVGDQPHEEVIKELNNDKIEPIQEEVANSINTKDQNININNNDNENAIDLQIDIDQINTLSQPNVNNDQKHIEPLYDTSHLETNQLTPIELQTNKILDEIFKSVVHLQEHPIQAHHFDEDHQNQAKPEPLQELQVQNRKQTISVVSLNDIIQPYQTEETDNNQILTTITSLPNPTDFNLSPILTSNYYSNPNPFSSKSPTATATSSSFIADTLRQINFCRQHPTEFVQLIEASIKYITTDESNRLIYHHPSSTKIALFKGKDAFISTAKVLKGIKPLNALVLNPSISIPVDSTELMTMKKKANIRKYLELKTASLAERNSIASSWYDHIPEPQTAILMMLVDCCNQKPIARKKNDLLSPMHTQIGISSIKIKKRFFAFYTFMD